MRSCYVSQHYLRILPTCFRATMSDIMGENEPNEPYRYKYNKLVVAACRDDAIRERVQRPRPCLMQRERERERDEGGCRDQRGSVGPSGGLQRILMQSKSFVSDSEEKVSS